ncbi:MAG: hypothetical protein PVJ92_02745 [Candidatus Dependentiae bacterium]|jgi:hypothetical protein
MASNILFSLFGMLLLSGPQTDTTLGQQDRGVVVETSLVSPADAPVGGPAREPVTDTIPTPVASEKSLQQDDGAAAASAGGPEREPMAFHAAASPVVFPQEGLPGQLSTQGVVAPEQGSSYRTPGLRPGSTSQQIAELERQEKELRAAREQQAREDAAALAQALRQEERDADLEAALTEAEDKVAKKKRTLLGFIWWQLTGKQHRVRNLSVTVVIALLAWWLRRAPAPATLPEVSPVVTPRVTPVVTPVASPAVSVAGSDTAPETPHFHGDPHSPGEYRYAGWTRHAKKSATPKEARAYLRTPASSTGSCGASVRSRVSSTASRELFQDTGGPAGGSPVRMNRAARLRMKALRKKKAPTR